MEYVYVIRESSKGFLKIGRSRNPKKRIESLQTSIPFDLVIVHCKETSQPEHHEREVHKLLSSSNIRGEWFSCSDSEAIRAVDSVCDGKAVSDDRCYLVKWDGGQRVIYGKSEAKRVQKKMKGQMFCSDSHGNRVKRKKNKGFVTDS